MKHLIILAHPFLKHGIYALMFILASICGQAQTDALHIDSTGNVGIGTMKPSSRLEVKGLIYASGSQAGLGFGNRTSQTPLGSWQWYSKDSIARLWTTFGGAYDVLTINNLGTLTSGNITSSGNITASKNITSSGNILSSGNITSSGPIAGLIFLDRTMSANNQWQWYSQDSIARLWTGIGGVHDVVAISSSGYVGIGTSTPLAPLHITTSVSRATSPNGQYSWLNKAGAGTSPGTNPTLSSFSIIAEHRIKAFEFDAVSDQRIKAIKGISASHEDLITLNKIEITEYQYIDRFQKGDALVKGLIAQQLETVFPQAVNKGTDFIPNIYALAAKTTFDDTKKTLEIVMDKPHHLAAGDRIRVITEKGEVETIVSAISDSFSFAVSNWTTASDKVFVYGKQVADFRTVNYDRVFTLGLSAMQELSKEVAQLKAENEKLKTALQLQNETVTVELELIRKQMASLNTAQGSAVEKR